MKSEPDDTARRNHCVSGMSATAAPEIARSTNPPATIRMSITGSCLSQMQYEICMTRYPASVAANQVNPARNVTSGGTIISTKAAIHATRTGSAPDAIARKRFLGWARSDSMSSRSLSM